LREIASRLQVRGSLKLHANARDRSGAGTQVNVNHALLHGHEVRPLRECASEIIQHWMARVEQMQSEIELLARFDDPAIQCRGTNHEWPRPIGKPTGSGTRGC